MSRLVGEPVLPVSQAGHLRAWLQAHERAAERGPPLQVIAVTSGKGGVGKSCLTANLAVALARRGRRVLAVDGDLGLANLDLLFGVVPRHTVVDVLAGTVSIEHTLVQASPDVTLLPACSGRFEIANLDARAQHALFSSIDTLEDRFDALLVDTASGLGPAAVAFAGAAQQVVLVVTPDPTSLADAYALAKVLRGRCGTRRLQLVANMVRSAAEGEDLYGRLAALLDRFVGVSLEYLGPVSLDHHAGRAVRAATPLLRHAPQAPAAQCIEAIAGRLLRLPEPHSGGIRLFWRRLLAAGAAA